MNTFVGDIVDSDSEKQWQNSLRAISLLEKKGNSIYDGGWES
ncbi:hypothetical protein RCO48_30250 [Peribacillus frigoritolerans]|nr:hypothetical protein [Peribacillus frigoritolerans]